jgi:hypothetical protein
VRVDPLWYFRRVTELRVGTTALRIFTAHGLAYPIAAAWAFAAVPRFVVSVASEAGVTLDDATVVHRVLCRVAWPAVVSFVLAHAAGAVWALHPDPTRGRRIFVTSLVALAGMAALLGGGSWFWLMTR